MKTAESGLFLSQTIYLQVFCLLLNRILKRNLCKIWIEKRFLKAYVLYL